MPIAPWTRRLATHALQAIMGKTCSYTLFAVVYLAC